MKNSIFFKFLICIILSILSVLVIFSITNNISTFDNANYTVILRYILSCCIVIIGLIIIFGFIFLNKINELRDN